MSEPIERPSATSDPHGRLDAPARRALRAARIEAVIVLAVDVALLAGLAVIDKAKGWGILDVPWWAWLLLAAPALIFMVMLLTVPLAELSPGRLRNAGIASLGVIVAADVVAVGVLVVALTSSSTDNLSAGDLLAHGTVVWLSNIITFGLLFWQLDGGVRAGVPTTGGSTPTSSFRRMPFGEPAGARD